tara:strand:+ start:47195 stop:48703 length:1509 start_codon:yes stop_codon:yes gene_type:complete
VRDSFWAAALVSIGLLWLYLETIFSMIAIWSRSDTFAHGFLILPISLWLVWMKRDELAHIAPVPAPWVALLLLPASFGWMLANMVDVLVVQQLALVAMLIIAVWAVIGHSLALALAFPLGFLFFAVPIGEGLIAPMMDFTAVSTVHLVRVSGIPVFREGLYFELPSGRWSVVEACSGVRYIIASVTVGTLFAYLTYVSWWRRALFILISAIVPVFANTLRAYIIVMLGHFSDMTVATGADHLVYGWVFFGVVIFILFWLGSFFREDMPAPAASGDGAAATATKDTRPRLLLAGVLALIAAGLAPLWEQQSSAHDTAVPVHTLSLPAGSDEWQRLAGLPWAWQVPSMVGGERRAFYQRDAVSLGLVVQFSDGSFDAGEVIGSSRLFVWNDSEWKVVDRNGVSITVGDTGVDVDEARLRGPEGEFLVWSWYQLGTTQTANDYIAKLLQAAARLGLRQGGAWRILLLTPVQESPGDARAALQDFIDAQADALAASLAAKGGDRGS